MLYVSLIIYLTIRASNVILELMMDKPVVIAPSNTESIAQSIFPYDHSDSRAQYLGYRCCGFTSNEALQLMGMARSTLNFWRKSSEFKDLESRLPELRETLGLEYAKLEFLRNYRLVLHKDCSILNKSINYPDGMSDRDYQYLLKVRSQYTPQQLGIMEALARAEAAGEFNFTDVVLKISREKQTVELKGTHDKVSEVQDDNEEDR